MANLVTRSELLTYCPGLSSVANATLDAYIEAASDAVESYCNRHFALANVTERHPYRWSPRVYLKRPPVVLMSNVTLYVRGEVSSDPGNNTHVHVSNLTETSTGEPVSYVLNPNSGVLTVDPYDVRTSSEQVRFLYFYEVNYRGGYANIPAPVKAATAKLVESMSSRWGPNDGIQSERIGDYAYTKFPSGAVISPTSEAGLFLAPYVRLGVNGI